nr:hypothetical protein [Candidatus Calescibacterium sp.]
MQERAKRRTPKRTTTQPSPFDPLGSGRDLAREFLACALRCVRAPSGMLFIPSLHESPLLLAEKRVSKSSLENHLQALPSLLKEAWKEKKIVATETDSPFPRCTIIPVPGWRSTLGVLVICTKRPLTRERKNCLKTMLSFWGTMLERCFSVTEESTRHYREKILAKAQELHRGIAQQIAGLSLFAAALREHLTSCSPKDRESHKLLDTIDTGLKQSTLYVHILLQELHEDIHKHSGFRENLRECLESRGFAVLRTTTRDFAFPMRTRKLFLEIAKEGEEAIFQWSKEKRVKVKMGIYGNGAYLLFQGDGAEAQDFPFIMWHTQNLQEKVIEGGGRLRVYRGKKGGITIGVMVPVYGW